jgi:hypothetical protein
VGNPVTSSWAVAACVGLAVALFTATFPWFASANSGWFDEDEEEEEEHDEDEETPGGRPLSGSECSICGALYREHNGWNWRRIVPETRSSVPTGGDR